MLLLDPLDPAFVAIGVAIGVTAENLRIRRRCKNPIGSAAPPAPKYAQAIKLMHDAAQTAFGRKPFRMRDLWPGIGAKLMAMGVDCKTASHYLWTEARNGGQFLHTEHHGYYVVTAEVVLAIDHIKPNAIILNRKIHSRLGPLVAAMLLLLSGWFVKPVHMHDLVHPGRGATHHLKG